MNTQVKHAKVTAQRVTRMQLLVVWHQTDPDDNYPLTTYGPVDVATLPAAARIARNWARVLDAYKYRIIFCDVGAYGVRVSGEWHTP